MDLGISGKSAIICASSRGLGKACALSLAREGVNVTINGLDADRLETTAAEIRGATGVEVTAVAANINDEAGRRDLLAAVRARHSGYQQCRTATRSFRGLDQGGLAGGVEANMLAPIMMIRGVIEGLEERQFGRIINITSAMVKAPFTVMGLSTAARSGLTAFCKSLSRRVARNNVTINNLLPERIDTDRQVFMAKSRAEASGMSYEEARQEIVDSIAAKRMGRPEEFGDACAYLCSVQASYISGQNLQIDGGTYPGVI